MGFKHSYCTSFTTWNDVQIHSFRTSSGLNGDGILVYSMNFIWSEQETTILLHHTKLDTRNHSCCLLGFQPHCNALCGMQKFIMVFRCFFEYLGGLHTWFSWETVILHDTSSTTRISRTRYIDQVTRGFKRIMWNLGLFHAIRLLLWIFV